MIPVIREYHPRLPGRGKGKPVIVDPKRLVLRDMPGGKWPEE